VTNSEGLERRQYPRTPVSWPARIWVDDSMLLGRAIDISEQGLCLLTAPTGALKRGECYRVDVLVGSTARFSVQGEVRHVTDSLIGLRTVERLKLT
jgi:hypothetical protein